MSNPKLFDAGKPYKVLAPTMPLKVEVPHVCRTCHWAKWTLTPKGHVSRKFAGHCDYVVPDQPVPVTIWDEGMNKPKPTLNTHRHVWWHWDIECPCWKAKEKP